MYDTYNQAKELYAKPRLKWRFCKWKHSPLLPVWRRGNSIRLYKRYNEIKEIRDKFPELPIDDLNEVIIKSILITDSLIGLLCSLYILFI